MQRKLSLLLILLLVVATAACGGSGDDDALQTGEPLAALPGRPVGEARPPRNGPIGAASPTTEPELTEPKAPTVLSDFELPEGPSLADVTLTDAPTYLFLFTHTEDHINHELSDERYWRIGAMIEALADAYPDLDLTWTIEFMGADAEDAAERNGETGLVDYLLSLQDQDLVEFGYHAQHDPTYSNRPQNDLPEEPTYEQAYDALWTWITCRKDPLYGGCIEDQGGGIEAILDAFGQVKIVTGLGIGSGAQIERTAGSLAVRELVPDRMLSFGFPDHGALQRSQQYISARDGLLALLTPTNETTSGTFWMDNSISINDSASLEGVNAGALRDGPEATQATLESLDGSQSFVINVGIADKYLYTADGTSPTIWAYSHPDTPELPEQYLLSDAEREKQYAQTQESLDYLAQTVTESDGGLQFVSADEVIGLFTSDDYWNVDADELEQVALWTLNQWNGQPPNWTYDGEDFYSLSDTFALLVSALQGSLADSDVVSNVYGPWSVTQDVTPAANVQVDTLRSLLDGELIHDGRIDETYEVGGQRLTATQLLYALSALYVFDRNSVDAGVIEVPQTATAPETMGYLDALGCTNCLDTAWSFKPARFQDESR